MFAPIRRAVSSSCEFIRNPPSPHSATTRRSGWTSLAAIAPGQRDAHRREAVRDDHRVRLVGLVQPRDPDLVRADVADHDVLRAERPAQVDDRLLGLDRPAVVVLVGAAARASSAVRRSWWTSVSRVACRSLASRPPMPSGSTAGEQPAQRPVDVADRARPRAGSTASTSAGCVSMWMIRLRPSGFQRDGRVLDQVVADGHHEVGAIEARSARGRGPGGRPP